MFAEASFQSQKNCVKSGEILIMRMIFSENATFRFFTNI